jgi:hypothetical protein
MMLSGVDYVLKVRLLPMRVGILLLFILLKHTRMHTPQKR